MNPFDSIIEYKYDGRDFSVAEFRLRPKPTPAIHRVCIRYDADRDLRILAVLAAVYFADREIFAKIVGVAESSGVVDFWCTDPALTEGTWRALSKAARSTLYGDSWKVNPGKIVSARNGVVDWEALPSGHPLYIPAKGYQLGTVVRLGGGL